MTHIDEDCYKLDQARELFSDMYNSRKQANKGSEDDYTRAVGNILKDIDAAKSVRKAEETKATPLLDQLELWDMWAQGGSAYEN